MHKASRYWTLWRLSAAGHIKPIVLSNAQAFFQQHFPTVMEPASLEQESPTDASIQGQLFALRASTDTLMSMAAELCLRVSFPIKLSRLVRPSRLNLVSITASRCKTCCLVY